MEKEESRKLAGIAVRALEDKLASDIKTRFHRWQIIL